MLMNDDCGGGVAIFRFVIVQQSLDLSAWMLCMKHIPHATDLLFLIYRFFFLSISIENGAFWMVNDAFLCENL